MNFKLSYEQFNFEINISGEFAATMLNMIYFIT